MPGPTSCSGRSWPRTAPAGILERRRATRMARWRFWAFLGLLLLACLVIAVTVWDEITKLFGL